MIKNTIDTKLNLPLLLAITLFLTAIAAFAQRPNPTPTPGSNQALTSVSTDSTLTGNGKTTAPLGIAENGVSTNKIADGAVTSSKLATTNTPQSGQVLTFNGTGLSWQTSAVNNTSGPLRFVDSLGNEVGIVNNVVQVGSGIIALRYIESENTFIYFYLTPAGVQDNYAASFYYESTDCTGTAYLFVKNPNEFAQPSIRIGDNFYYPTGNNQSRHILSEKFTSQPCEPRDFTTEFCQTAIIPVSNLGTPPFKLSR
jgi:hypothetical protein